jgi:squalene synthase HpnC
VSVGHYENFPVASLLLPPALREPVAVIYRFARSADDFADEGNDPPQARLEKLQAYTLELEGIRSGRGAKVALFADVARIVRAYDLPLQLFQDLVDAFSQDVVKNRYADYPELLNYSRRSANPVGRLLLQLFGCNTPDNNRCSDAICSALQLINFWQDVDIDYSTKNRIYLPQDEMARFEVSEAHLHDRRCDAPFRALMAFQVRRARELMEQGKPLLDNLKGRFRLEIALTVQGGLRILEKLEAAGFDVFHRRPVLKAYDWPVLAWRAL